LSEAAFLGRVRVTARASKFSKEVPERAERMVFEHRGEVRLGETIPARVASIPCCQP
jgi:hypothetical protein